MMYAGFGGIYLNPNISEEERIIATTFCELREYAGPGVPPDYVEAAKWVHKAAEQGLEEARMILSFLYRSGQQISEAKKWELKLAEQELKLTEQKAAQDDAGAQFGLGRRYAEGQGVPRNHAEAMEWYLKAAERGSVQAQWTLAHIYHTGQNVPPNNVEAYKWYTILVAHGDTGAAVTRDVVLAKEMTPAKIAKAELLAREWMAKHFKAQ